MMIWKLTMVFVVVFSIGYLSVSSGLNVEPTTLRLIHVLFRHGERAPDFGELYPQDPQINSTFYPVGFGQLTNKGKKREYNIGKALRFRYNKFLGNIYLPDILEGVSSNIDRTKASLQLVLTGLFPPIGVQTWNQEIHWQPIPTNYKVKHEDLEFFGKDCKSAVELYKEYIESNEYQEFMHQYDDVKAYIEKHTGWNITSRGSFANLYFNLITKEQMGIPFPEWAKAIFPSPLTEITAGSYVDSTATLELKKYAAGFMLKKIVNDGLMKINTELSEKRKVILLSGHEINCAYLLRLLGVFKPHVPTFGSYVILELHEFQGVYGYKVFYHNYSSAFPKLLNLPGCGTFCPLEDILELYQKYLPDDNTIC